MFKIVFRLYLIAVFVIHIMKVDEVVDLNSYFLGIREDHWMHGILFLPMGFLSFTVLNNRLKALIGTVIACFFFETLQYFLPYRTFDFWDIVADSVGAFVGILVLLAIQSTGFFQKLRNV